MALVLGAITTESKTAVEFTNRILKSSPQDPQSQNTGTFVF